MKQCVICHTELEVRECAPCDCCGANPEEIEHFNKNMHIYRTYEIYKGLTLTLCDFCDVDFGSHKPEYFGFTNGHRIGLQNFNFIKELKNPQITKAKFCNQCLAKHSFLKFIANIRQLNLTNKDLSDN